MSSTYPSAPDVCCTRPATPSFPLPPSPTGQLTELFLPTFDCHWLLTLERKSVHTYLVPLPSERCTTTMSCAGSFVPGFALAMAASFHFVIVPRKIPASASGVNFSPDATPGTLYAGTTAPSTVGKCRMSVPRLLL